VKSLAKSLTAPFRAFFNTRFESLAGRLDDIDRRLDAVAPSSAHAPALAQLDAQRKIEVSDRNTRYAPAPFSGATSIAVSAAHFDEPDFRRWYDVVRDDGIPYHRKPWEYAFVLDRVARLGLLAPGRRAVGFGVGREPISAVLAAHGVDVLATDLALADAGHWTTFDEHAAEVASLSYPHIVDDATLAERVSFRAFDMNDPLDGLGRFDLVWSCCAIEHLGSPDAGFDYLHRTTELLQPGGVSIHTTEYELTDREDTADYGHCAIYRTADFEALAADLTARGFLIDLNLHVAMDSPLDRYVALPPYPVTDDAHLKLAIFESVSTSIGLVVRRPTGES
jgi:hypothetical protein